MQVVEGVDEATEHDGPAVHEGAVVVEGQVGEQGRGEAGGGAAVEVVDDGASDVVADPEAGAGVAEQPAGAVDDAIEAAAADGATDGAGPGDEGGTGERRGSGCEEGEQIARSDDRSPDAEGRDPALHLGVEADAGARMGEEHQLDRPAGGGSDGRRRGERLRDRGAHRGGAAATPREVGLPPPERPKPRQRPLSSTTTARVEVPPASTARNSRIVTPLQHGWTL